jgi:hypothetical protein
MSRLLLALSITAMLVLFMALGWLMHWLWQRAHRIAGTEEAHRAELTARLHAAELARDAAERQLAAERAALAEAASAEAAELTRRLAGQQAELAATMEALREARQTAAEWRRAYEAVMQEDREDP